MAVFTATLMIALILALGGIEILLHRHVIPFDAFEAARQRFQTGRAGIAVFGDSRAASGLTASDDVANFAAPGDSLDTTLGKAEDWHSRHYGAKLIIAVDPQQFSRQRLAANQRELLHDFITPDSALPDVFRSAHRRYLLEYLSKIIVDPAILWRDPVHLETAGVAQPFAVRPPQAQRDLAERRIQHHAPLAGFRKTAMSRDLRARLEAMRDAGGRICLVTMPVSSAYRQVAHDRSTFARVRDFYRELAQETGLRYLDLWGAYPDLFFSDPDHLMAPANETVTDDILNQCFGA